MSRVFLMKWYHFTVEYFEDLRNVNHCEFLIMRKQPETGKYILENQLRTWAELRRERAALLAKEEKENGDKGKGKDSSKLERHNSIPAVPRRWGGCPEGCNHGQNFKIRRDLAELRQHDEFNSKHNFSHAGANGNNNAAAATTATAAVTATATIASRRAAAAGGKQLMPNNSDDDSDDPRGRVPGVVPPIDVTKARDEVVSSPDGTPSFINIGDRLLLRGNHHHHHHHHNHHHHHPMKTPLKNSYLLHVGRDGGGTYSGHASEEEASEISEDDARRRLASIAERVKAGTGERENRDGGAVNGGTGPVAGTGPGTGIGTGTGTGEDAAGKYLGSGHHALANRLGDASPQHSDRGSDDGGDEAEVGVGVEVDVDVDVEEEDDDDLDRAEALDKSVRGSVY